MDGSYLQGQQFLCVEQVAQIGTAVHRIDIRSSVGFDRRVVVFPFLVAHVHDTVFGKEHAVSSVAGRHYTVEHVDTAFNAFQNIYRSPDSHEVARTVGRKYLIDYFNHFVHLFSRFAYCQSADCVSIGIFRCDVFCRAAAQVRINATLYDREERLLVTVLRFRFVETGDTAVQPAVSQFHRFLRIIIIGSSGSTFIESHHDIGTDGTFDIHYTFRCEHVFGTVNM